MSVPEVFMSDVIRGTAIVAAIGLLGIGASVLIGIICRKKILTMP